MEHSPLAERMRPHDLDEVVGQEHLVGPNGILRKALSGGRLPSMILWGPPGVGKTTLARLVAERMKRPFHALSAINSGVKDVREVIEQASGAGLFTRSAVLFIDEIHRFNKAQQDSLLGAVEKG
ncbi:MAG TPA: AAA family ATPase, partial [Flavobacteriales bacterium]|nr:AAA family ATPase [Flavobacteriales bacterium]